MTARPITSKSTFLATFFLALGIGAMVLLAIVVLLTLTSYSWQSGSFLDVITSYRNFKALPVVFGLIALGSFMAYVVTHYSIDGNAKKVFFRLGLIFGILALLTFPSGSIIVPIICSLYGIGCGLASIGLVVYFLAALVLFIILSVLFFAFALVSRNK